VAVHIYAQTIHRTT